jgi:hypothetical protein
MSKLIFCFAEDREGAEIGLKLGILSLTEHCPGVPIVLYRPAPIPSFTAWLRQFPDVRLVSEPLSGAFSWNCKPHAMLPLLDEADEVVWLDSDMMVSGDPRPLFSRLGPETLGITQEPPSHPDQGSAIRTQGWGLKIGRPRDFTLNSSALRTTHHHAPLLRRWMDLMTRPDYVQCHERPVTERPVAMKGDQDVLNALLGSDEFTELPVRVFWNGRDVIHSGGALAYPLTKRLAGLFRPMPTFVHAISLKPWMILVRGKNLPGRWWWWRQLNQEISPYVALAKRYRARTAEPMPWLDWSTPLGTVLRVSGLGHWALRGLPVTAASTFLKVSGLLPQD